MRYVLIGGSGFIGKNLSKGILSVGGEVIAIGRKHNDEISHTKYTFHVGDCNDVSFLDSIVKKDDVVIYLAYNSVPKTSFENPIKDIEENLPLAISIFSVVARKKVRKLVYLSSGGTIYGRVASLQPLKENSATNPISPYGITKLAIEKYANFYAEMYQIPLLIIRPSNPYGELQLPFRGQGFIATAVNAINNRVPLDIFGLNGTIRDYIYIDDLVEGILVAITKDNSDTIFNIGSGIGRSNFDVINTIKNTAGLVHKTLDDIKINILPSRHFDVPYNVLDCSKLKLLGWRPKINFEVGVARTLDWWKEKQYNN
ncbi:NAD-dependent epimerase/dehydratase family protein [Chitinophaga sp. 30R24]|uniref:NAD-dependent epimerase/dehydratase family protein n=1 Tax=Chitinophaga sp. 30R24 TaxID=3248838 RepID=UPI003B91FE15